MFVRAFSHTPPLEEQVQIFNTQIPRKDLCPASDYWTEKAIGILYVKTMIDTPSRGRVIDISVAGLMTSVQETILSFRHGEKDEDSLNHRAEPADVYRLLEVNLQPNEQRRTAAVFEYKGLVFRLVPKRYFEHQGSLYRFIYLKKIYEVLAERQKN